MARTDQVAGLVTTVRGCCYIQRSCFEFVSIHMSVTNWSEAKQMANVGDCGCGLQDVFERPASVPWSWCI
jgi:hypothetical protein